MKIFFQLLMLVLLLGSCSKTQKDLVIDEFKKYVNENFDAPKNLEEIVAVEATDTTTKETLCYILSASNTADSLFFLNDSIISEYFPEKMSDNMTKNQRGIRNLPYYKREKILDLYRECLSSYLVKEQFNKDEYKKQKLLLDSITLSLNEFEIIGYEIKARVKESNELKLHTYYGLVDNNGIRIFKEKPAFEEYSAEVEKFLEIYDKYTELQQEYISKITKLTDDINAIKEYLKKSLIII